LEKGPAFAGFFVSGVRARPYAGRFVEAPVGDGAAFRKFFCHWNFVGPL
jgi:hypothetical protein